MDGQLKRYMLEILLGAEVALVCLDVLAAKWDLLQVLVTINMLISGILVLISYVVRDQSIVNKNNGHTETEPMVKDG